ncbi:MAG: hypothetical protein EOP68_19430 [Sphingomonas sp.]|nr:MAG: hypothetical protein EOP68_19430 [Sphingomonas sp.]
MKVTIEIDCTPEEARRTMGLPDLTPLHDKYLDAMGQAMDGTVRPELIEQMLRSWAPMGEAGMAMWRRLLEGGVKQG